MKPVLLNYRPSIYFIHKSNVEFKLTYKMHGAPNLTKYNIASALEI